VTPSDRKTGLTWTNPSYEDFSHTIIVRDTRSYPATIEEGTVIYNDTGNSFLDKELENGIIYYYTAIAYDKTGNAGEISDGSKAEAVPEAIVLNTAAADPFADAVKSFQPLNSDGHTSAQLALHALGPPQGAGKMEGATFNDIVSLHARINDDDGASAPYGGSITLEFNDNIIVNGTGPDFIIFENVFFTKGDLEQRWIEPAIVSVSQDGRQFHIFPYDFVPHYKDGVINHSNPHCYKKGFAGINPVYSNNGSPDPRKWPEAGGDAFDLNEIGLDWVRFIRITSTGDNWLTDINGDKVRHATGTMACSGAGTSGFDLDAVCAINY